MKKTGVRLNSWHALLLSLGVSTLALAALWVEVFSPRRVCAEEAVAAAARRLDDLKVLSEDDISSLDRQTADLKAKTAARREELKVAGVAEIPSGEQSIVAAQQAVLQALVQRKLKVLEASAAVREEQPTGAVSAAPADKPVRELTAAEFEAESMKAAAALDAKMRGDYLKRVKAQVAKMKAVEAAKGRAAQAKAAEPKAKRTEARGGTAPFKTKAMPCRAQGRFKDVFLFFVDETLKKPAYDFADIAVRRTTASDETMDLSFTLRANYR